MFVIGQTDTDGFLFGKNRYIERKNRKSRLLRIFILVAELYNHGSRYIIAAVIRRTRNYEQPQEMQEDKSRRDLFTEEKVGSWQYNQIKQYELNINGQ